MSARQSGQLSGKRAIVTGAKGAFGAETVDALRAQGAEVLGIDLTSGPDVLACDISDPEQVERTVADAVQRLGGLDLLVNCAGIGIPVDAGAMPGRVARSIVDVNLWGQWQMTAAALPALLASRGRIIFVASGLAYGNVPYASAYSVSKRGLTAYADALRIEYGDYLDVTTVYPGYVPTPIHEASDEVGVNVGHLVRSERVKDVVATIVGVAVAANPPRDRGTTRVGHFELLVARHLPSLADRVIGRKHRKLMASGRYDNSPLVRGVRARVAEATGAGPIDSGPSSARSNTEPEDPEREHTVMTSDGVRLRVRQAGPTDAPVTVVFLHGWCLSQELFDPQWTALSDRPELRLISYDLRGHGRSGAAPSGSTTIDQLGDDLATVLDHLEVSGSVVTVGHSMGGMSVMGLAASRPELFGDLIGGAVLVNSSAAKAGDVSLGLPWAVGRVLKTALPIEFARRAATYRRRGAGAVRPRILDAALSTWLLRPEPVAAGRPVRQAGDQHRAADHARRVLPLAARTRPPRGARGA